MYHCSQSRHRLKVVPKSLNRHFFSLVFVFILFPVIPALFSNKMKRKKMSPKNKEKKARQSEIRSTGRLSRDVSFSSAASPRAGGGGVGFFAHRARTEKSILCYFSLQHQEPTVCRPAGSVASFVPRIWNYRQGEKNRDGRRRRCASSVYCF